VGELVEDIYCYFASIPVGCSGLTNSKFENMNNKSAILSDQLIITMLLVTANLDSGCSGTMSIPIITLNCL